MTHERWQRALRIIDAAFAEYLTGMAALGERVVVDLKRKLTDSHVLDRPHQEQPGPRPASAARHQRARGRRPRG